MQGKKIFTPKLFHSFQLSERVPADNFYRRILSIIDFRWLYEATRHLYGDTGNPGIDPVVFFKFMLVGYLENIISDRKLIEHCSMRMDLLLFLGYDIDEELPWHSTISRSRQLYGESIFEELFTKIVNQCIEKGMVSGHTQCVDSALIKANASLESIEPRQLQQSLKTYITESKQDNVEPQKEENEELVQPGIAKKIDPYRQNQNPRYSTTDPDARLSQKPGKPLQMNYLASMSVDSSHHVITHIQADHADSRDSKYLKDIVSDTRNRLKQQGIRVENIVADTNYSSGDNYSFFERQNITAYIPVHGKFEYEKEGFTYDKARDAFICRNNKLLAYKRSFIGSRGTWKKEYRSDGKDCRDCLFRQKCLAKNITAKKLETSLYHRQNQGAYERQRSRIGNKMRRLRTATVEPVFAHLIHYLGLRKIPVKGKPGANKCMLMAAMAYNLKKLLKFIPQGTGRAIIAIEIEASTDRFCFFNLN